MWPMLPTKWDTKVLHNFSREYSREFGIAPKQDVLNQPRLYNEYASRTVRTA